MSLASTCHHSCSTPVLATLLAYVSSTNDPLQGGALLLTYTSGYVTPLLVAATFTVSIASKDTAVHLPCISLSGSRCFSQSSNRS